MEVIERNTLLPGIAYKFDAPSPRKHANSYICARLPNMSNGLGDCGEELLPSSCPNCPKDHAAPFERRRPASLYRHGKPLGDILWHYDLFLIKEEWVPRFEREAFTGFDFRPVNLYKQHNCKGEMIPGFVEMFVTGRVPVDEERSGVEVTYRCPLCGLDRCSFWKADKGLHFVGDSDDRPDLFMTSQNVVGYDFASPRFAKFVMDSKLQNVELVRIEDLLPPE